MTQTKFSYKEAIAHGWKMTKKYLKTLFIFAVIYILFNVITGMLQNFAGGGIISRHEVTEVYKDSAQADLFTQYLQEAGYINKYGQTQDKLRQLITRDDLILPSNFEDKRDDIYDFLNQHRYRLPFPKPIFYGLIVILWVINMLISIGFIKACLMMSRDVVPSIAELFSNGRIFIPYLLASICYGLVILGGFILLIIPGIIFMIMFEMYPYLIIDKGLGPIQSLKRSCVITKGSRGRLAVFGLLLVLLNIGGLLCLVIGLFFTISISSIAACYVYDRLENTQVVTD